MVDKKMQIPDVFSHKEFFMSRSDAYTDKKGNEFPIEFGNYGHTEVHSRISENGLVAVVGYLTQDSDYMNPREENENFGTMICFHDRYNLGDKHTHSDPFDFRQNLAGKFDDDLDDKIEALNNDRYQELVDDGASHDSAVNTVDSEISALISSTLEENGVIMLPLNLYDHSGLSMSVSGFSCQWDSGQVGWIYVTGKQIEKEYGDRSPESIERAKNLLKGEVETYDQFLRGDVFGINIETFVNAGSVEEPVWEQENIDSCWGYFGYKFAEEELKSQFEGGLDELEILAAQKGAEREAEEEAARIAAMAKTFVFEVKENHDPDAGITFYGDSVSVTIHSGNPGGEERDFVEHIRQALAEWYDAPVVAMDTENKPAGPKM